MQEPALTRSLLTLRKPIQEVLGNLRELFPEVTINTNLGSPAGLEVHAPSFYRLLQNLVSNACKHANQQVLISTFKTSSANCLAVEDDGPGVSPPERDKIFEAFYRTDNSRNKQTGGYGLGLAIVSRIISMHEARIEVSESTLGGAKFTVLFPLSKSNQNADSSVQNP